MQSGRRFGRTPVMSSPSSRMRPASGRSKPAKQRKQRRLPATRWAEQGIELARLDRDVDIVERRQRRRNASQDPSASRIGRRLMRVASARAVREASTMTKLVIRQDRCQRVDVGRHTEAHHRVDLHRQRRRRGARACREVGDDELVDRQREREQCRGENARKDHRQRHAPESRPVIRPEVDRGLDDRVVETREARAHDRRHERDVEDDVARG